MSANPDSPQDALAKTASVSSYHDEKGSSEALKVVQIDRAAERRALWKIDLIVIPLVGMLYLLSFLDRSNIGNARVAGLQTDLKMTNKQYSIALTTTYVPYIVMELPANLLMKRLGPNITLPIMVVLWGIITTCQGTVTTFGGLLACRFFLGAAEGGLFPGIVLYLSSFYKRHSLQYRFSLMFSTTSLAGAFSGLLAAAIEQLNGRKGKPGWAWIFIIEGVFTVCFGLFTFFVLPNKPADTPLLTEEEKVAYTEALRQDWSGDEDNEPFSWSVVLSAFKAPHVLLLCIPLFFSGVTLYGLAFFTPSIVSALGFSANHTQLLTVPPYACSFVVSIICSYLSDKYRQRGLMGIFVSLIAVTGYAIFLATPSKHKDYGALFLQIVGVYSIAPCLSTWNANNVQPHFKRATAIALAFVMTNAGGILSTWIFNDPPRYRFATRLNLGFATAQGVMCAVVIVYFSWRNRLKREMVKRGEYIDTPEERLRLGDEHPLFLYTL